MSQLYRLLDPTNYNTSLRQLIALLYYLGFELDVEVKARRPLRHPEPERVRDNG